MGIWILLLGAYTPRPLLLFHVGSGGSCSMSARQLRALLDWVGFSIQRTIGITILNQWCTEGALMGHRNIPCRTPGPHNNCCTTGWINIHPLLINGQKTGPLFQHSTMWQIGSKLPAVPCLDILASFIQVYGCHSCPSALGQQIEQSSNPTSTL